MILEPTKETAMKLYYHPVSPNSRKPRLVARELGLTIEEQLVDLLKGEQKTPEFLALNPNGKVPLLTDGDLRLWESNAICLHLAGTKPGTTLLPEDRRGRIDIARWQSWELAHLTPAIGKLLSEKIFKKLFGRGEPDPAQVKLGEEQFQFFGAVLNGCLEGRRYLVGDKLTVADLTVAPMLALAPWVGLEPRQFKHVGAWLSRIEELDSWKSTVPPKLPM